MAFFLKRVKNRNPEFSITKKLTSSFLWFSVFGFGRNWIWSSVIVSRYMKLARPVSAPSSTLISFIYEWINPCTVIPDLPYAPWRMVTEFSSSIPILLLVKIRPFSRAIFFNSSSVSGFSSMYISR